MTNYKIKNFTDKTPKAEQTKLETNLKGVSGVDTVALHPENSEVSLSFRAQQQPQRDAIEKAVTRSGFQLAAQK
jgi:cation transport ATPase